MNRIREIVGEVDRQAKFGLATLSVSKKEEPNKWVVWLEHVGSGERFEIVLGEHPLGPGGVLRDALTRINDELTRRGKLRA